MEMRGVFEYLEAVMLSPVRFGQLRTDLRNTSNFAEFDTLPTRLYLPRQGVGDLGWVSPIAPDRKYAAELVAQNP